jgi:hypothetical protein
LLFGFAWFLYRKMWAFGALLLILPVALFLMFETPGGQIGLAVAMAMFAKSLYVQHALSRMDKARARGDAAMLAAGGVSIPGALVGGFIIAASTAWVIYLI